MIEPYQVVGLIPTIRGIRHRDEIRSDLDHIAHLIKAATWLSSLDLPVRLIAIPEGGLQGFTDEILDLDHEEYARDLEPNVVHRSDDNGTVLGLVAVDAGVALAPRMVAESANSDVTMIELDERLSSRRVELLLEWRCPAGHPWRDHASSSTRSTSRWR